MEVQKLIAKLKKVGADPAAGPAAGPARARRKVVPVVHDQFILASQEIEQRDIQGFIRGQAEMLLNTADFYSCHTYNRDTGILIYYLAPSTSFDHGKFCCFAPAMAKPGTYVLRHGLKYYLAKHSPDGVLTCDVHYEHQVGTDLLETEGLFDAVPDTLQLSWSLHRKQVNITLFLAALLAIAAIFWGFSAQAYKGLSARAAELAASERGKPAKKKQALPDVGEIVSQVAPRIGEHGRFDKVTFENNKLLFSVKFNSEDRARAFMIANGGDYAGGLVVFGFEVKQ